MSTNADASVARNAASVDTAAMSRSLPLGRVLMVQGTSSHAGKSTLVAAFCRLFANAGYRVAPFKAQNMSNNAAVTDDGGEVGRAQAMQATAARVAVTVDMNPVLLKPQSDRTSQIVVLGRVYRTADAVGFYGLKHELWPVVAGALDRLRAAYDVVVIEGAGSPAEINLAQYDIVNMRVAAHADAPVIVVGDIERGGVFASLYGTVMLLPDDDRARIRGFIINKFRGDPSLLDPGFAMLERRTGVPTLGVLPYLDLSRLPAEDGVEWGAGNQNAHDQTLIDVAVMRLPRVANLDEFQPLAAEPGVHVRFIGDAAELGAPDLIIIPGTKSTLADLAWLREQGLDAAIAARAAQRTPVIGICGGFQMLGTRIVDEQGAEAQGDMPGLGLLPVTTVFSSDKVTRRVTAHVARPGPLAEIALDGYEIHMGRTESIPGALLGDSPFVVGDRPEGVCSADGLVAGTYIHGLLENPPLLHALVVALAKRKGVHLPDRVQPATIDAELDRLASLVRENVDMQAIAEMTGLTAIGRTQ
ncbi:MAG: cobQ [Gemmatimonadetes bacterium]|nr:cobQ [Gemmatimonadota bacterium]